MIRHCNDSVFEYMTSSLKEAEPNGYILLYMDIYIPILQDVCESSTIIFGYLSSINDSLILAFIPSKEKYSR
jgi:hypothetical protein